MSFKGLTGSAHHYKTEEVQQLNSCLHSWSSPCNQFPNLQLDVFSLPTFNLALFCSLSTTAHVTEILQRCPEPGAFITTFPILLWKRDKIIKNYDKSSLINEKY